MGDVTREYLVLTCPWDSAWDVFVLDSLEGLIATAAVPTLDDVEDVARRLVNQQSHGVPEHIRLTFLRR